MFSVIDVVKNYGPFAIPSQDCEINGIVQQAILRQTGVSAEICYCKTRAIGDNSPKSHLQYVHHSGLTTGVQETTLGTTTIN